MSPIAERVKQKLTERHLTIAVAESLTGGNLQAALTSVSGSSVYFLGGVTAYNIDQKVKLLGVDREHAAEVNCVSQQVAIQMATGSRQMFGSDIGLATTGYAEACQENGVHAPFAFIAIDLNGKIETARVIPGKQDRIEIQQFVADAVMNQLFQLLFSTSLKAQ